MNDILGASASEMWPSLMARLENFPLINSSLFYIFSKRRSAAAEENIFEKSNNCSLTVRPT